MPTVGVQGLGLPALHPLMVLQCAFLWGTLGWSNGLWRGQGAKGTCVHYWKWGNTDLVLSKWGTYTSWAKWLYQVWNGGTNIFFLIKIILAPKNVSSTKHFLCLEASVGFPRWARGVWQEFSLLLWKQWQPSRCTVWPDQVSPAPRQPPLCGLDGPRLAS